MLEHGNDASASADALDSQALRILLIDDEQWLLDVVRTLLKGYRVTTAVSGREALEEIAEQTFDVIFCDLAMPVMDGVSFYETLVKDRPDAASRVVFTTGGAFSDRASHFLNAVRNPVLAKPYTHEQIEKMILRVSSAARPAR